MTGGHPSTVQWESPIAVSLDLQLAEEVVRLRAFDRRDISILEKASADPDLRRFLGVPPMHHRSEVDAWIAAEQTRRRRGERLTFAIVPVGGVVMVGACGISSASFEDRRAQLGIWVMPRARRRGFACATARLVSVWALGSPVGLERLELQVDADNSPGRRTAERAGYELEATLRSYQQLPGRRVDTAMYSRVLADLRKGSQETAPAYTLADGATANQH